MFLRRAFLAAAVFSVALAAGCGGQAKPSPAEQSLVDKMSQLLAAEFPTRSSAERAGYMALSDKIDSDNTYDLTDMKFSDVGLTTPNFLWFDRNGKLVGADYEFPKSSYPRPPAKFPAVDSSRWTTVDEHVHLSYVLDGKTVYAEHPAKDNLRKGAITPDELRTDGYLPDGATLKWAEYHPAVWDLAVWLVPNPNGAFADRNPSVK